MQKSGKKILILYTSVGLGHKSIAENIAARLSENGHVLRLEDILRVEAGKLASVGTNLHQFINRRVPAVWSWLYNNRWVHRLTMPLRTWVAGGHYNATLRVIREFKPDIVISTQTTASAVMAFLVQRGLYSGQFGIAFSDYHFHPYWLYPEAGFYLANTEEQVREMQRYGMGSANVFVLGITLPRLRSIDALAVKASLGIGSQEQVVLVSAGSLGVGLNRGALTQLVQKTTARLIVVCGKNVALKEHLTRTLHGTTALVTGFYSPMEDLYAIADVYVTKPGGLSVAESLRHYVPIIVTHHLPGQEEQNLRYLTKRGLVSQGSADNIVHQVAEELRTHSLRVSLRKNPEVKTVLEGKDWRRFEGWLEEGD